MKKTITCIILTLALALPATMAGASQASQFGRWITATNPVIQRMVHHYTALTTALSQDDPVSAQAYLYLLSTDAGALDKHLNSPDSTLNMDIARVAYALAKLALQGTRTLNGGSMNAWTNDVVAFTHTETVTTARLKYDENRWQS